MSISLHKPPPPSTIYECQGRTCQNISKEGAILNMFNTLELNLVTLGKGNHNNPQEF